MASKLYFVCQNILILTKRHLGKNLFEENQCLLQYFSTYFSIVAR